MKKRDEDSFNAKVASEAMQEGAKVNELAAKYGVHPNKVSD